MWSVIEHTNSIGVRAYQVTTGDRSFSFFAPENPGARAFRAESIYIPALNKSFILLSYHAGVTSSVAVLINPESDEWLAWKIGFVSERHNFHVDQHGRLSIEGAAVSESKRNAIEHVRYVFPATTDEET